MPLISWIWRRHLNTRICIICKWRRKCSAWSLNKTRLGTNSIQVMSLRPQTSTRPLASNSYQSKTANLWHHPADFNHNSVCAQGQQLPSNIRDAKRRQWIASAIRKAYYKRGKQIYCADFKVSPSKVIAERYNIYEAIYDNHTMHNQSNDKIIY